VTRPAIEVEVVYALPLVQDATVLRVPMGTTAQQAIALSGVTHRHREIDFARDRVAVYGKLVALDVVLQDHDRVEILRVLQADPKQARRRRALHRKRKAL
jgi:uncharacterized protein